MKDIKITIITVCRNAEKIIEETIQSVVSQTYTNIEYIIVDGASTDSTMDIVRKYAIHYSIKCISEPDKGIYDAMNKGILLASGDYIQFLNAGDFLYEEKTVQKIVNSMQEYKADIFYGSIIYKYSDSHTEVRKYGKWCSKKIYDYTGDCINHQAIFAATDLLKSNQFDIHYKICADREWIIRVRKAGAIFKTIPKIICFYSLDDKSASISQKELYEKEADECIKQYYSFGYVIFKVFQFCRNNKILSNLLHGVYRLVYIRKS